MLTGLRVQNFKSWKDSGDIRLAPVTVIFGANSSGKTSLIQFLLMLRQTVESTDPADEHTHGSVASKPEPGIGRVLHVGPIQEPPKRNYLWSGALPTEVGDRGEKTIEALLAEKFAAADDSTGNRSVGRNGGEGNLQRQVISWLREMRRRLVRATRAGSREENLRSRGQD